MDFRKLTYFEAVCREKSFTKAAQILHVTQPSVTIAVRDLENELNVCLIDRCRGEFTPTPEGAFVLQRARYLIQTLEETEQEIHAFLRRREERVRIGYAVQIRSSLSTILSRFRNQYPGITVMENESPTPAIAKQLENGELDLGVVAVSKDLEKNLVIRPLFQGELRVCVSKQNLISQAPAVTLEEFERQPLISLSLKDPMDSYIFHILQDAYPNRVLELKPHMSSMMLDSYFRYIENNDGVGLTYYDPWFTPTQYQKESSGHNSCILLPFDPPCQYNVAVVFTRKRPLNKQSQLLSDFIQQAV